LRDGERLNLGSYKSYQVAETILAEIWPNTRNEAINLLAAEIEDTFLVLSALNHLSYKWNEVLSQFCSGQINVSHELRADKKPTSCSIWSKGKQAEMVEKRSKSKEFVRIIPCKRMEGNV